MTKELKVFLGVLALGGCLIIILKYLFPLMAPFLFGIAFACIIEPLVKKLDNRLKVGRKLAVIFILATLVISILSITGLSLIAFYQEAQRLIPRVPELVKRIWDFIQDWLVHSTKYFPQLDETLQKFVLPQESVNHIVRSLIMGVINFLPRFPQLLLAIGLGGVTAYFFSRDQLLISKVFYRFIPKSWQKPTVKIKTEIISSVTRFIRVECTLALITTILTTIVLYLLGTPGALAYGFLTGVLDFLPVLGPGLIYIPLALISLLFNNYHQAIWLIVMFFLVLLIRQVIEYKLIGENLNLHPILSIFVIYIGINVFGLAGIFLGPLLIITLRAFYRIFMSFEHLAEISN